MDEVDAITLSYTLFAATTPTSRSRSRRKPAARRRNCEPGAA